MSSAVFKESFDTLTQPIKEGSDTSHTVDLPLLASPTNEDECVNFCGPTSKCALTNKQCSTDNDCGCNTHDTPENPPDSMPVIGENDAGKMGVMGSTFSILTTDMGSQAQLYQSEKKTAKPFDAYFGKNTWRSAFDEENKIFDERYKQKEGLPKYGKNYTVTGMFETDDIPAANAYLNQ